MVPCTRLLASEKHRPSILGEEKEKLSWPIAFGAEGGQGPAFQRPAQ